MLKIIKDSALVPTPIVDLKLDSEPRQGSTDPVTSEGVANAIAGASGALDERLTAVEGCIPDTAGADNKLVTQSALDAAEAGWQAGYTPKGNASVSTLNGLTGQSNGDTYILTDSGTLTDGSLAVSAGDSVAWDATNSKWYKFKRELPLIYNDTVKAFRGIRIHVGNSLKDTSGCVCVGMGRNAEKMTLTESQLAETMVVGLCRGFHSLVVVEGDG